jgi:hypothetical protein
MPPIASLPIVAGRLPNAGVERVIIDTVSRSAASTFS